MIIFTKGQQRHVDRSQNDVTHLWLMFPFYTPWKHQETLAWNQLRYDNQWQLTYDRSSNRAMLYFSSNCLTLLSKQTCNEKITYLYIHDKLS